MPEKSHDLQPEIAFCAASSEVRVRQRRGRDLRSAKALGRRLDNYL
jgi:hypothetical protein